MVQFAINIEKIMRYALYRKLRIAFDYIHYTALRDREQEIEESKITKCDFSTPLRNKYSEDTFIEEPEVYNIATSTRGIPYPSNLKKECKYYGGGAAMNINKGKGGVGSKNLNEKCKKGLGNSISANSNIFGNEVLRDTMCNLPREKSPNRNVRNNRADGLGSSHISKTPKNSNPNARSFTGGFGKKNDDKNKETPIVTPKSNKCFSNQQQNCSLMPIKAKDTDCMRKSKDLSKMSSKTNMTSKTGISSAVRTQDKPNNSIIEKDKQSKRIEASPIQIRQKKETNTIRYKKDEPTNVLESQNASSNKKSDYKNTGTATPTNNLNEEFR